MLKRLSEINPDVWTEIDPLIFENDRFTGLKRLRESLGIRLIDARFIFGTRYWILRENNSNEFHQAHEEYWEGVYE
jgi:DNA modification methylase